jgi:hypothetical protein
MATTEGDKQGKQKGDRGQPGMQTNCLYERGHGNDDSLMTTANGAFEGSPKE